MKFEALVSTLGELPQMSLDAPDAQLRNIQFTVLAKGWLSNILLRILKVEVRATWAELPLGGKQNEME